MANGSTIEWTEATWNPVTGCTKVSPGCKNCYAERLSQRLQAMGLLRYRNAFSLTLHHDSLERWVPHPLPPAKGGGRTRCPIDWGDAE